jgi:hypothetical protein
VSSDARKMVPRALALAIVAVIGAGVVEAQTVAAPDSETINVEVDPIGCWWRTSTGAIRVGEPFVVVLTCAVIENAQNIVVPDQSRLEPTALQLPPFEVMGGRRFSDSRTADRRFFQYEYRARLIQDDAFGTDARLPPLELKYRIRTRTPDGSSVEGRELIYILPPVSVRVLSLVPADASDIRDATDETFSDLDAQAFRANVLRVIAGLLFSLGAVMAMLMLVRLVRQLGRAEEGSRQLVPDALVLRRASRELAVVQREREQQGWSDELAGRALSALRIVGAYALARRTNQIKAPEKDESHDGYLVLPSGWRRRSRVLVSGSVTGLTVGHALVGIEPGSRRHTDLEHLQTALARFGSVQYGRDGGNLDEVGLDESLARGLALARRLAMQYFWPIRKFSSLTGTAATMRRRVWSR